MNGFHTNRLVDISGFIYTDLRDDRPIFNFSMKRNETKTFVILLNAVYLRK